MVLVVFVTVLMVCLTLVLAIIYFRNSKENEKTVLPEGQEGSEVNYIAVATPTPTPVLPLQDFQNPQLYPASAQVRIPLEITIDDEADPAKVGLTQNIMTGNDLVTEYTRSEPINMGDPLEYSAAAGILTFRGNNFRNSASFGYVNDASGGELTQVWEYTKLGVRLDSSQSKLWSGILRPSQPLIIRWPDRIKGDLNLYPEKKNKAGLTEVVVSAMDGKLYFLDLDDGTQTRDPIDIGASIKGTPSLDPRGYPLIYVGQGDDNSETGFGMYVYSLIDGSRLYFYDAKNDGSYRMNWGAFDSSPLVDAASDTLIWPCENGIIYTFKLNTSYTPGAGNISINPERTGLKYIFNDQQAALLGVEGSIAVYGNFGYFCDNDMKLVCLDLNSMKILWARTLGDDCDMTPVVTEEGGVPFVYIATEVENQGGKGTYSGAAYTYKFNGLTGAVVWQTSQPCHTYNADTSENDQTGGCIGNPISGKKSISDLIIFSYSMTSDLAQGNILVAYDKNTGTERWRYNMNKYAYSSPVDIYDEQGNAYIVIGDSIGQIHLVYANERVETDAEGNEVIHRAGERVNHIQTSRLIGTPDETSSGINFDASPAIYGNMMVIGTTSGSIMGIRIGQ